MIPFRTILVAADFSERSREAFRVACALAREDKTRIYVLHVVVPNDVPEAPANFGEQTIPSHPVQRDQGYHESLKEQMRAVYTPDHALDVEYHTREGDTVEVILRKSEEIRCDLIVMGTHGRTGLDRLLTGSIAEAVLRRARCPVLALRSPEHPRGAEPIQVILHPTDFSDASESALQVARSLARDHAARLVVLHVAPSEILIDRAVGVTMDPRDYRDALEAIRGRLEGPDLKYPVEIRQGRGDTAAEILQAAEALGCGLIAMGTHGRTGLGRLLMGSVAEAVLRQARCPVLAVKVSIPIFAAVRRRSR
jgi:nucleotide-binding universal stress UspA family protein